MLEIEAVVWGVKDSEKAIQFWSKAFDDQLAYEPDDDIAILKGKGVQLSLKKVTSLKASRHHMDLFREDKENEVNADHTVLEDLDGNRFCICQL